MIDNFVELAATAAMDVESMRAAKKHRWVRHLRMVVVVFSFVLLAAGVYVTLIHA
jgi:hypothetical protein